MTEQPGMSQFKSETSDAWQRRAEEAESAPPARPGGTLEARAPKLKRPPRPRLDRRNPPAEGGERAERLAWAIAHPDTQPAGYRRRRRVVPTTRDMVAREPRQGWIGSDPNSKPAAEPELILMLEAWLFGNPEGSESSWKRAPAEPEPTEWPLPAARPRGQLKGREVPRMRIKTKRGRREA